VFNSALLAGAGGQIVGRYDKQVLLAFGEYLPLGETFPILYKWFPSATRTAKGTSLEPFLWGEHRISALICYEDIQPALVNRMVRHANPDLLVNLTNDAWFGDSTEPWIHLGLAQLRAVEQHRYLVRATSSGVSAIIDAKGTVVTHGGTFQQEAIVGQARFLRGQTGYGVVGDLPWYAATLLIMAMAILPRRRGVALPGSGDRSV
jgi:apolipoprotein N-acyltransferase